MKAAIFLLMLIAFMPLTLADELPIDEPKPKPIKEQQEITQTSTSSGKAGRCNLDVSESCSISHAQTKVSFNGNEFRLRQIKVYPSISLKNLKFEARYVYGLYLDNTITKVIKLDKNRILERDMLLQSNWYSTTNIN